MEPVRIKYYGLVWMTKRSYLVTTAVAGVGAALILGVAAAAGLLPPFRWPWEEPALPGTGFGPWFYNHLYLILGVLLLLEVVDIVTVLRKFARKEAEQKAAKEALTKC